MTDVKNGLAVKREMMRTHYKSVIETRKVLTPEQRLSFDMGVVGGGRRAR